MCDLGFVEYLDNQIDTIDAIVNSAMNQSTKSRTITDSVPATTALWIWLAVSYVGCGFLAGKMIVAAVQAQLVLNSIGGR